MRSVPRYLLEKVIKKSVTDGDVVDIAGNKVYGPVSPFERGCFEAMSDITKVNNVEELESALNNPKVHEILIRRDQELNSRNLTNILENNRKNKTLYCSFSLKN